MGVQLPVRSVLAEPDHVAGMLIELKPGDVIPIEFGADVPVMVAGDRLGTGTVGTSNGHAADPSHFARTDQPRGFPMNDMTGASPSTAVAANFRLLQDVDVKLTVEIGSTSLTLRELLALGEPA
jgi:flagellar motor switch/type III secretory pathway protein FliN